jgi:hypothetical protein
MIDDILELEAQQQVLLAMPPESGMCAICGIAHKEDYPHDANSTYYKYFFHILHKRLPTWEDAMSHCSEPMKRIWVEHLESIYVDVGSQDTSGGVKTKAELERRKKQNGRG